MLLLYTLMWATPIESTNGTRRHITPHTHTSRYHHGAPHHAHDAPTPARVFDGNSHTTAGITHTDSGTILSSSSSYMFSWRLICCTPAPPPDPSHATTRGPRRISYPPYATYCRGTLQNVYNCLRRLSPMVYLTPALRTALGLGQAIHTLSRGGCSLRCHNDPHFFDDTCW